MQTENTQPKKLGRNTAVRQDDRTMAYLLHLLTKILPSSKLSLDWMLSGWCQKNVEVESKELPPQSAEYLVKRVFYWCHCLYQHHIKCLFYSPLKWLVIVYTRLLTYCFYHLKVEHFVCRKIKLCIISLII